MTLLKGLITLGFFTIGTANADTPSTHGMLLFGDKVAYASHLPMFHTPHDYQVILKLKLSNPPTHAQTLAKYAQAKAAGSTLFTIEPERMDLTKVIDGTKKSFSATLYDGHFERGGMPLGGVNIEVTSIVFAAKLNSTPAGGTLDSYLVFGEKGEYFSAHLIDGKPNFDAIASVSQPVLWLNGMCIRRLCPSVDKLISDSELPITLIAGERKLPEAGMLLGSLTDISTSIDQVIHLEEGELSH